MIKILIYCQYILLPNRRKNNYQLLELGHLSYQA